MIRRHADRNAALAKARSEYDREHARIKDESRLAVEKATQRLREAEEAHVAARAALQAEHAQALNKELPPILAPFSRDGGTRELARELIAVCRAKDELVLAELGTELRLAQWLALAFCRAEIASDPGAELALGSPSAWVCESGGFGDEAHAAAAAVRAGDVLLTLAALERLEAAVHKVAVKLPRDPRNARRLDAIARCVVNIEPLEKHDHEAREAEQARITEKRETERDLIRRYRAGDVDVAVGKPPGWVEAALRASEELFGRLAPKMGGTRRAYGHDPVDQPDTKT